MKKKILYLIIAAIALLAAYRIYVFITGKVNKNNKQVEREVPVRAVAVDRMNIIESMDYTGDIVGIEVVNVFPQVSGKIRDILRKEGQRVVKGQTLFKIDRDIVGMEYMPAIVESPITGYIGKIMVDKGVTVSQAVPLAQVVNMSDVEAVIYVIEENINKVSVGMAAEIRVAAFPDKVFMGTVNKKSAVVDPMSRTLEVHVLINNQDLKLKHGMYADVKLIISKKQNALIAPVDSILTDEDGTTYVMTVNGDKAVRRNIKAGITYKSYREVLSGLSGNEVVITLGKENVIEGSKLLVYRDDIAAQNGSGEK